MSRHLFDTHYEGRPVQVVLGWDRPLRCVFLTIEWRDQPDHYLYSNLDDPHARNDLGYYTAVLERLGIEVPMSMIRGVMADRVKNIGNRLVEHFMEAPLQE